MHPALTGALSPPAGGTVMITAQVKSALFACTFSKPHKKMSCSRRRIHVSPSQSFRCVTFPAVYFSDSFDENATRHPTPIPGRRWAHHCARAADGGRRWRSKQSLGQERGKSLHHMPYALTEHNPSDSKSSTCDELPNNRPHLRNPKPSSVLMSAQTPYPASYTLNPRVY
jgi:hypothetical protein